MILSAELNNTMKFIIMMATFTLVLFLIFSIEQNLVQTFKKDRVKVTVLARNAFVQ